MAEYRKSDWKVQRRGNQLYIQESVVRKPEFEEKPEIEYGHSRQVEINRQKRKNREFAQAMNRRYISFLTLSAMAVFISAAVYLSQISETSVTKKKVQTLEAQLAEQKLQNDEMANRMDSDVNPEEICRTAIEELGMVYAEQEQVIQYQYEESDYVRQYEEIPKQ